MLLCRTVVDRKHFLLPTRLIELQRCPVWVLYRIRVVRISLADVVRDAELVLVWDRVVPLDLPIHLDGGRARTLSIVCDLNLTFSDLNCCSVQCAVAVGFQS